MFSKSILPLCSWTIFLHISIPKPLPFYLVVTNGVPKLFRTTGDMPPPSSSIVIVVLPISGVTVVFIIPLLLIASIAFL